MKSGNRRCLYAFARSRTIAETYISHLCAGLRRVLAMQINRMVVPNLDTLVHRQGTSEIYSSTKELELICKNCN